MRSTIMALAVLFVGLTALSGDAFARILTKYTGASGPAAKRQLFKSKLVHGDACMSHVYSPVIQGRNGVTVTIFTRRVKGKDPITMARVETQRYRQYIQKGVVDPTQAGLMRSGADFTTREVRYKKISSVAELSNLLSGSPTIKP